MKNIKSHRQPSAATARKLVSFCSLTLLTTAFLLSCGGKTSSSDSDFTKSYEGTINGKYEFIMTLTKTADQLSGTYRYKKGSGTSLKLSGTIDQNGNLTLNEFNEKSSMTGIFKGQLAGATIIGSWTKPDGSGVMPFALTETEKLETSIKGKPKAAPVSKTPTVDNWTGTYVSDVCTVKIEGPKGVWLDVWLNGEQLDAEMISKTQARYNKGSVIIQSGPFAGSRLWNDIYFTFKSGRIVVQGAYNGLHYKEVICKPKK